MCALVRKGLDQYEGLRVESADNCAVRVGTPQQQRWVGVEHCFAVVATHMCLVQWSRGYSLGRISFVGLNRGAW